MTFIWGVALLAKHRALAFSGSSMVRRSSVLQTISTGSVGGRNNIIIVNNNKNMEQWMASCQRGSPLFMSTSVDVEELSEKIKNKGDEIRQLKADGVDKAALAPYIAELQALKSQLPPSEKANTPKAEKPKPASKEPQKKKGPSKEMSESELRLTRLAKVEAMRKANIEPFEYTYDVTRSCVKLASEYEGRLQPGEEDEGSNVAVAGRIMTRRVFGKLAFFTLQDESGTIQLQFDSNRLGDSFEVSEKYYTRRSALF
jgi:hypothetical protein